MPAAAVPWVSAGIGALGLLQSSNAARQGQNTANAGLALQQQVAAAQMEAFNEKMDQYKSDLANGVFNPDSQIATFRNAIDANQKIISGNMAGEAAMMGYRPGDTAPLDAMGTQANAFKLQEASGEQAIRQNVHAEQQNELQGLGNTNLGSAGAAGNSIMNYGSNQASQGMAGELGSLNYIGKAFPSGNSSIAPYNPTLPGTVNSSTGLPQSVGYQRS